MGLPGKRQCPGTKGVVVSDLNIKLVFLLLF